MKLIKLLVFLFPIFFAMPDLVINFENINLRYDDIIIYLLFITNLFVFYRIKQHYFIKLQLILLMYVFISLIFVYSYDETLISRYEVARTLGSIPYLLILPYLFNKYEYRKLIYKGAFIGAFIYLFSIFKNYNNILTMSDSLVSYSSFKKSVSFETLNPNAVASIALIFAWLNILAYYEQKKIAYLLAGLTLFLIPFFIFARGSSIGVLLSIILYILFQKKNIKQYLLYILFFTTVWFVTTKYILDSDLYHSATNINLDTGEGTSGRLILWEQGLKIISQSPIFGKGFATEAAIFRKQFDGHMTHQILLHYTLELGIIVLIVFLYFIIRLLRERIKFYKKTNCEIFLVQFSLLMSFLIADMTGQLLYFNKYAFIIFVMATFNPIKNRN